MLRRVLYKSGGIFQIACGCARPLANNTAACPTGLYIQLGKSSTKTPKLPSPEEMAPKAERDTFWDEIQADYRLGRDSPRRNYTLKRDEYGTPGIHDPNLDILLPTWETHNMLVDGVPYKELPVAHIKLSKSNVHIVITDARGTTIIGKGTSGTVGFKNAGKRSDVAGQTIGYAVGQSIRREGYKNIKVVLRGLGTTRESSVLGLTMAGIKIISITDATIDQTPLKPRSRPRR